jgi:hypothetical protein
MTIDYEMIFGTGADGTAVEFDPCIALNAIRPAYFKLISGEGEQKIQFRDREVWFRAGDVNEMKALVLQLQQDCAAKQGVTLKPKRFAVTAGSRHIDRGQGSYGPPFDPFRSY